MRFVLCAILSLVFVTGAWAASTSTDPKKPKPVDVKKEILDKCGSIPYGLVDIQGRSATKEQMEEGKFQVTSFITQVDVYQDCMLKLVDALGQRLTPNDLRLINAAIAQSQSEKEAVGAAFNNAVCEYNFANNIPDKDCDKGKLKDAAKTTTPQASGATPPAKKATTPATTPAPTTTPKPKTP